MKTNLINLVKRMLGIKSQSEEGKYLFVLECSLPGGKCKCKQWINPIEESLTCKKLRSTGQKSVVS